MGSDGRLKDRLPVPLQSGKRTLFIGRHQPGIADDVGRENGSQFPIDPFFGHKSSGVLSPPDRTMAVRNITLQRIHPAFIGQPGYKNLSSRISSYRADWYRAADP